MTFTTKIKDEITKTIPDINSSRIELLSYIKYSGNFENNKINILIENASVARYIFKLLKVNYNIDINLTIRIMRKFSIKRIYILNIKDKVNNIIDEINSIDINNYSNEEFASYLKGLFLSRGTINDPSKSKYHLGLIVDDEVDSNNINKLLNKIHFNSKTIRRDKGYMIYIKSSEEISDFIKLLGCVENLFYYEDIRIYRDHKNMVNRLNNCEQANIEKSMKTSKEQIENIEYLNEHDLIDLLDDKIKLVIEYKMKYPETTMNELAYIISKETDINLTKSCINHYFRKIKDLVNKDKNK